VISLSGGADSATCAVLVAEMARLGVEELGEAGFAGRLGLDPSRPFMGQLLTCAYQPTENSGPVTQAAAESVAASLGARYFVLDVQPMLTAYRDRGYSAADCPHAVDAYACEISLPLHLHMDLADVDRVVDAVKASLPLVRSNAT